MKRVTSHPEDSPRITTSHGDLYRTTLPQEFYDIQLLFLVPQANTSPFLRNCSKFLVASLGEPLRNLIKERSRCVITLESEREIQAFDIALSISHSVKLRNVPLDLLVDTVQLAKKWRMGALFGWLRKELGRKHLNTISLSVALGILEGLPEEDYARELKGLVVGIVGNRLEEFILEPSYLEKVCLQIDCCLLEDHATLHQNDKFTIVFQWIDKEPDRQVHLPMLVEKMNFSDFEPGFFYDVVGSKAKLFDCVMAVWSNTVDKLKVKEVSYLERSINFETPMRSVESFDLEPIGRKGFEYLHGYTFSWNLSWDLKKREISFRIVAVPELFRSQGDPFVLPVEVETSFLGIEKMKTRMDLSHNDVFVQLYEDIGNITNLNFIFKIKTISCETTSNVPTENNLYHLFPLVDVDPLSFLDIEQILQ